MKKTKEIKPSDDSEILRILKDIQVDETITRKNVHFLTQKVNNIELRQIQDEKRLSQIEQHLDEVLAILETTFDPTTGSKLTQTSGGNMAGLLSIIAGQTGTFVRSNLPAGSGGLATGTVPSYSVDDPAVNLGPDPSDPSNTDKFSAAVPASDTGASFNITVTITPAADASGSPGAQVQNVFNVTINPAPPPPFVPTTGSDLTQTS